MTMLPRQSWVPGVLLLGAAAGVTGLLGLTLGLRGWPWYLGIAVVCLLSMGWMERLWTRRRIPPPPRSRSKLKVIQGGKGDYDLSKDDSTDSQRYLM